MTTAREGGPVGGADCLFRPAAKCFGLHPDSSGRQANPKHGPEWSGSLNISSPPGGNRCTNPKRPGVRHGRQEPKAGELGRDGKGSRHRLVCWLWVQFGPNLQKLHKNEGGKTQASWQSSDQVKGGEQVEHQPSTVPQSFSSPSSREVPERLQEGVTMRGRGPKQHHGDQIQCLL